LAGGDFSFPFYASVPKKEGKIPFFVLLNFRDGVPDRYLPAEEICDAGYAVLSVCYQDVTPDREERGGAGDLAAALYPDGSERQCGKIAMWAWAASRMMDYAQTVEKLDMECAAVVGHSRLGKTALLAGALDERFTHVISNDSGCGGAAVFREKQGERIQEITGQFPYWFRRAFGQYAGREAELPFDQHFLLAAAAPRKVYVASAAEDTWADPDSEYLACYAAGKVYERLGMPGFVCPDRLPAPGDVFHEGSIGYHLRPGAHYLSREDWQKFIAFLNRTRKNF
jgi:hypothetical protein